MPIAVSKSKGILRCADAYQYLSETDTHTYDAIITDPPYEIGIAKQKWDMKPLNIPFLAYHFHRVVRPTGNVFVFCSDKQFGRWYDSLSEYFDKLTKFAWHTTNPLPRGKRFISSIELGLHAYNKTSYFNSAIEKRHNFFESPRTGGKERLLKKKEERQNASKGQKSLHPTQKPEALIRYLVECLTKEGDFVLDPFAGLYTAACVCTELRRDFTCLEYLCDYSKEGLIRDKNAQR